MSPAAVRDATHAVRRLCPPIERRPPRVNQASVGRHLAARPTTRRVRPFAAERRAHIGARTIAQPLLTDAKSFDRASAELVALRPIRERVPIARGLRWAQAAGRRLREWIFTVCKAVIVRAYATIPANDPRWASAMPATRPASVDQGGGPQGRVEEPIGQCRMGQEPVVRTIELGLAHAKDA